MRVAFSTFGCKINQYDTELMRREFASRGSTIVSFDDDADVYIINTCTVTSKSDYQCRQAIRSIARRGKTGRVVVTGCYAETRPDELRKIPGVGLVIGNSSKSSIVDQVAAYIGTDPLPEPQKPDAAFTRTRGVLKIQDGCDARCSYCIVPAARGRPKSMPPDMVVSEFNGMVSRGCPEVVLTGIHVGCYGEDLDIDIDLEGLLRILLVYKGSSRIRLSSIEPQELTPGLISMLGNGLCRHLHIPLQSGDDSILRAMNRRYTAGFYMDLINRIAKEVPDIGLGADVMVGFPGEGDKEFENTLRLIESLPVTYLHVFSFSPRPGTSALDMKGQVPESVKKERSAVLRQLGIKKNLDFRTRLIGKPLDAVVINKMDDQSGWFLGITDNYVRVVIEGCNEQPAGKNIKIAIKNVDEHKTLARIC